MAVKIKLKRLGKIREPYYRIVVADARTKRDGRAIEEIGKYHPKAEPSLIEVNSERVQHWLSVGAQPTEPVRVLLKVTGDWQKFTGEPGTEGTLRTAAPRADKKERFAAAAGQSKGVQPAKEEKAAGRAGTATRAARTAKESPAKDTAAKEGTAKDTAAKDGAAGDGAAGDGTARSTRSRASSAKGAAAKDSAAKDTAAKDTAAKDTAAKDTAAKDTAAKETAGESAAKGARAKAAADAGAEAVAGAEAGSEAGAEADAAAVSAGKDESGEPGSGA